MGYLAFFLIGIAIGQAYRAWLTREMRRQLASSEEMRRAQFDQNQRLSVELFDARKANAKIRAFAARIHMERIQRLGGMALLPAAANVEGQRTQKSIQ